jgi:hypothetical protein
MSPGIMRSAAPIFFAWIVFSMIQACDQPPVDQKAVLEEMQSRELKRIPETEIFEAAEKMGDTIAEKAQLALQKALLASIKTGGIPSALEFCNVNALPILQEVAQKTGVEVYRVTDQPRNPDNLVDSLESLILEAYGFNQQNNLELAPSVIKESSEVLLYTKPITIANGLCLNCHGKIGNEIKENDYDTILAYYPDDKAIDYQLNELRGMWVMRIPVQEIVRSL